MPGQRRSANTPAPARADLARVIPHALEPAAAPPGPAAVEALVRRHQVGVYRFLRALGCPPADAEALAADTFVVAHLKRFAAPSDAAMAACLRETARRLWLEQRTRDRRREARIAAAAEDLWRRTCAADDGDERLDALQRCLAALRGRAAAAVQFFYRDGLSRTAAAARLGMRETGFKTLLQRLRAQLRECIERRQT